MRRTDRVTSALRGRKKAVTIAGAAAALLGAGTTGAVTLSSAVAQAAPASHQAPAGRTVPAGHSTQAKQAVRHSPRVRRSDESSTTTVAAKASQKATAADQLMPVGTSGAQAYMQLSPAQVDNAKTIVSQALAKKMGVRSAVIAVATSMQESMLNNINYGDRDSLGLFQQRPSCGWGSAHQILNPRYAADAFLTALKKHQDSDPEWGRQPLWANAQAVQASGFPYAYAKWEAQAAHLVKQFANPGH
jgi:hypothetical protein